jgi:mannose-6-phosphate isomerase-like protein (cupin superfamily)
VLLDRVNLRTLQLADQPAHAGTGYIRFARIAQRGDVVGACNFIDYAIVPPGASIGDHRHAVNEEEFYLVLSGTAVMRRESELVSVRAGDFIRNPPGGLHGLRNEGPEDVELFVFELEVHACEPAP